MNNKRRILFEMLLQALCLLWICCKDVSDAHLLQDDISLLKEEEDPKCFTRTEEDFTCFFETADNETCDFLYNIGEKSKVKRCDLLTQRTTKGMFLHICAFPYLDVATYVDIYLQVVERKNKTRIYSRIVSVEDHILLDAPFNVSLHHNDKAGELRVSCLTSVPKYWDDKLRYRIRYTSKGRGERTKEWTDDWDDSVMSLIPGEEVQVQVAVKCANTESAGHWSRWSDAVRDVAPQSADDISLMCFSPNLQTITCQWNSSRYSQPNICKLFIKLHLSEYLGWTDWTECLPDKNSTDQCSFQGDESEKVRVKLTNAAVPLTRTFYTQEFTLKNIIKTYPPAHLTVLLEKHKLCLKWKAPLMSLSSHLQYEVGCQIRETKAWVLISTKGPVTATCLEVPPNNQYRVKVRAKPNGSIYSGHWSEWSEVLTGKTPADIDTLLITCIPVMLLITAVILLSLGFTYFRKLKQYLWPPVPNLDKVLRGFLTEINLQKWDPPVTAKPNCEESTSSLVEVMPQDEVSGLGKVCQESAQLLSSQQGHHTGDQEKGNPRRELKLFPDYVTLSRDSVINCSTGNKYVCEQFGEIRGPGVEGELLSKTCHSFCMDDSVCIPDCLGTDFLNQSYLALSEHAFRVHDKDTGQRGTRNLYTNVPWS
ncbi:thrombopoietin receptor [Syngnathoides biaculeatus]|uniref:thrombopoietin receptor n=1 Tax=Syngnathoides biaculeatus TaxID=300417 RepID=UPI002ADD36F6|nr:thrombopoietin receptor [Syngnathoides biaculeatus]